MGTKYGRTRLVDEARESRLVRREFLPPKLRLGPRQRLLMIYSGILLFCAFALIGELYLRMQRPAEPSIMRGLARLDTIEGGPRATRATLTLPMADGTEHQVTASLTDAHQNLQTGQWVGVLYRMEGTAPAILEVGQFPVPPNQAPEEYTREAHPTAPQQTGAER